jgi:hypothetical protein
MESQIIIAMSLFIGALFVVLSIPLLYKKVPINIFYGFRVSKYVFMDKDIWYPVNRLGGKCFLSTGITLIVVSILMLISTLTLMYYLFFPLGIASVLMGIIYTWYKTVKLTHKLAREKGYRK